MVVPAPLALPTPPAGLDAGAQVAAGEAGAQAHTRSAGAGGRHAAAPHAADQTAQPASATTASTPLWKVWATRIDGLRGESPAEEPTSAEEPVKAVGVASVGSDGAPDPTAPDPAVAGSLRAAAAWNVAAPATIDETPPVPGFATEEPTAAGAEPVAGEPGRPGRNTMVLVMAAVAVLLCVGTAVALLATGGDDPAPPAAAGVTTPASADPSGAAGGAAAPSGQPSTPASTLPTSTAPQASPSRRSAKPSTSPRPSSTATQPPVVSGDATTAKAGDCFASVGQQAPSEMPKVACTTGTLKVIKRIDHTSDLGRCNNTDTPGWTNSYSYRFNNSEDTSFVLCLTRL